MEKDKYYVNLQSREISRIKHGNNAAFTIFATEGDIKSLRKKLDRVHVAENDTFWRAHIPIMPYHHDTANDRYDASFAEALQMIYDLGDKEARAYITETGVLRDRPLDV